MAWPPDPDRGIVRQCAAQPFPYNAGQNMSEQELSQEERILRIMKRVLTDVAKDTYAKPGFRHPLTDDTIKGMRDCLALITAREHELAEAAGRPQNLRPRFRDETPSSVVVTLDEG
jgi:hypothetical protein